MGCGMIFSESVSLFCLLRWHFPFARVRMGSLAWILYITVYHVDTLRRATKIDLARITYDYEIILCMRVLFLLFFFFFIMSDLPGQVLTRYLICQTLGNTVDDSTLRNLSANVSTDSVGRHEHIQWIVDQRY